MKIGKEVQEVYVDSSYEMFFSKTIHGRKIEDF